MRVIRHPRQSGFTLIELLVVILIVGLFTATVALSAGAVMGKSGVQQEAERLRNAMTLASEESILFNRIYGIKFRQGGYTFMSLVIEDVPVKDPNNPFAEPTGASENASTTGVNKRQKTERVMRWEALSKKDTDKFFHPYDLEKDMDMQVFVEELEIVLEEDPFAQQSEDETAEPVNPTLILSPDGEISPEFKVILKKKDSEQTIRMDKRAALIVEDNTEQGETW